MAFVQVPKDLNQIKTKFALGLTKRQLICFLPGVILGGFLYYFIYEYIDTTIALAVSMLVSGPFVIAGVYEKNGLFFEEYLATLLRTNYWFPTKRYKKGLKGGSKFEIRKEPKGNRKEDRK